jgi:hypothetical protein
MIATIEELQWSADALDRLSELRAARDLLDWMIERAVEECRTNAEATDLDVVQDVDGTTLTRQSQRAEPVSWARIADALGVSRQTAWERYRVR